MYPPASASKKIRAWVCEMSEAPSTRVFSALRPIVASLSIC